MNFSEKRAIWFDARDKFIPRDRSIPRNPYQSSKKLAEMLGYKYREIGGWSNLPDSVFDLLPKLTGPYGHAILKAYRIKKGLD
jgi:hypothetical protein